MPDISIQMGEKIKNLRLEKNMTIEEMADRSTISAAVIQSFEEMRVLPPLGNIVSLAKALEVTVGDLFGDSGDSPFSICRSSDRVTVCRFDSEKNKPHGYSYAGLGQNKRNRQMEPFLVTLNPNQSREIEANQHIGEEFLFVLEGQVEVRLLDLTDVLNKGDSIYYDSNMPHIISCHGDQPATILAVIYAKEEMIIL